MRRLILLRHAKTEAGSGDDFSRRLTERGHRDAAVIARALTAAGLAPDRVLVSSAIRAQETWEDMAEAFPNGPAEAVRALYLASLETLEAVVAAGHADPSIQTLMIIGHNPGLFELAVGFPSSGQPIVTFPTASAAVVAFDDQGAGRVERQLFARDFRDAP